MESVGQTMYCKSQTQWTQGLETFKGLSQEGEGKRVFQRCQNRVVIIMHETTVAKDGEDYGTHSGHP